jgi:hypothetical protein
MHEPLGRAFQKTRQPLAIEPKIIASCFTTSRNLKENKKHLPFCQKQEKGNKIPKQH